jgi:hypothetical protein
LAFFESTEATDDNKIHLMTNAGESMTFLRAMLALCGFATAAVALAQAKPQVPEPLPTDPKKRIYYGEYYDPEKYLKCWEKWIKFGDPRGITCEKYRERLEPLDPARRDLFGEFYDPKKYHECRARVQKNDMQCEYLKLRRIVQREIWPYPDIAKPKLPEAPNPSVYKWHMKAKEYFDALCKAEAGEFIYRTVDNVEGVYQIRPREGASHYTLRDRYVMEDPYGYTQTEAERAPNIFVGPKKYRFFEVPIEREHIRDKGLDGKYFHDSVFQRPGSGDKVARYYGYDNRDPRSLKKEYDTKLKSRYGYTWREIKRPKDRENAIVGGELIVLDLQTNEILGIRRGFIISGNVRNVESGIQWEIGTVCPRLTDRPGWPKDFDFTYWFVSKVLKPATSETGRSNAAERK